MIKSPEEWFKQAEYDLDTAKVMLKAQRYIYTIFMCHLSIEKALKGLYTKKFKQLPPKIHNLVYLVKLIELALPKQFQAFVLELNQVSVPTRYPEELSLMLKEYSNQRTTAVYNNSKKVLAWLKKNLIK